MKIIRKIIRKMTIADRINHKTCNLPFMIKNPIRKSGLRNRILPFIY